MLLSALQVSQHGLHQMIIFQMEKETPRQFFTSGRALCSSLGLRFAVSGSSTISQPCQGRLLGLGALGNGYECHLLVPVQNQAEV
jgi:hypothetical protein